MWPRNSAWLFLMLAFVPAGAKSDGMVLTRQHRLVFDADYLSTAAEPTIQLVPPPLYSTSTFLAAGKDRSPKHGRDSTIFCITVLNQKLPAPSLYLYRQWLDSLVMMLALDTIGLT